MKLNSIVNLWPPFEEGIITVAVDSVGAATGVVSIFSQVTYALDAYGQASGEVSIQSYSGSTVEVTA